MNKWLRQVFVLFKLRIGVALVVTALVGMAVTPGDAPAVWQTFLLATAVFLSAGAAGGFNHYYDHDIDAIMDRTKDRPFVTGSVRHTPMWLPLLASMLVLPVGAVAWWINPLSALYVFMGAFFYGVVYTVWLKRRTWLNIVIGGLAGSFAILAGATAVDPAWTPVSFALAVVLFLWTPSHFWSLAIALHKDYAKAGIPMLPVVAGDAKAARFILANTVLLVLASVVPAFLGLGWVYLVGAMIGGGYFLFKSLALVKSPIGTVAMSNFYASLLQLLCLLLSAFLDSRFGA